MRKRHQYLIHKAFQIKYTLTILSVILLIVIASGIGLYIGIWASIAENFSQFKVSEDLETAKRIADYEGVRYRKGDYRLEKIFREAELLSAEQRDALKNGLRAVNKSLIPKLAILAILIFVGGIFLSHKIAGPMYRFEKSAEAVKEGNLTAHFKIRKTDAMKKTASSLEEMVEALRLDMEKIKIAKESLRNEIGKVTKNLSDDDKKCLADIVKSLDDVLGKYKT